MKNKYQKGDKEINNKTKICQIKLIKLKNLLEQILK